MTDTSQSRGVIFDLDGVLINTAAFHKKSWFDLADKEGFHMTDHIFCSTFGMQNYQIIPILAGRKLSTEKIQHLSEWKEQRYRRLIKGKLTLLDGARKLIDDLKSTAFLLAIGTSTPLANLDFMLEQIPIRHCFDAYVTGEDVTRGKPAPDTFQKAAQKLALPAHRCVVVEDAVQGVQAAKAATMPVIAVTTTRSRADLQQADLIVEGLEQLKAHDFLNLLKDDPNDTSSQ
ncbi:MAG: HAD family hydrolase [Planctomycetota bacterium]|jgi:beta-phosphoglucomutase family hydrolase